MLFHVCAKVLNGGADVCCSIATAANKPVPVSKCRVDQIVQNQDLPVAVWAGPDADCGHGEFDGDGCGHLARNAFQNNRTGSSVNYGVGICLQSPRGLRGTSLRAKATHAMQALRSESEMAHHRNFCLREDASQFRP